MSAMAVATGPGLRIQFLKDPELFIARTRQQKSDSNSRLRNASIVEVVEHRARLVRDQNITLPVKANFEISQIRTTYSRPLPIRFALPLCVYRSSCSSLQLGSVFQ